FKAAKNEVEVAGIRTCHVRDGAALVRFFHWLEKQVAAGAEISEIGAADQLEQFRSEGEHFQGLSFPSISAFASHGALPHYRPLPDEEGHRVIDGSSLYLLDSGAQYLDGTTDVTRTVCFGEPTAEQVARFTEVLRGHVALARVTFPRRTDGKQLDVLARLPLWETGHDYGHGTGHGVGAYLNVHEGPQGISPKSRDIALQPGMVLSNEPGYYLEGDFGIRTENLVIVETRDDHGQDGNDFLGFETVTLAPIDRKLIDVDALLPGERAWLDAYHADVRAKLSPLLNDEVRTWLEAATEPL
ncbi:MAG: M24B family metallopeptidase, partial [Acidobacteriota bacterium]